MVYKMKKGDLVIYSDQETMPEWANNYGIIVEHHWKGDWRLCCVCWAGESCPTIHYKYELEIITNKGRKYGKLILEGQKSPKRRSG